MKYKVEYYTDTGTRSDNEFIGIYDTKKEAQEAKKKYIDSEIGEKPLQDTKDYLIEEWEYDYERLMDCVVVESLPTNKF